MDYPITGQKIKKIRENNLDVSMYRLLKELMDEWRKENIKLLPSLGIRMAALLDKID